MIGRLAFGLAAFLFCSLTTVLTTNETNKITLCEHFER